MTYKLQNVLHIATAAGPRSKKDPNSVLIGQDSPYPDAVCMQHDLKYEGQISWGQLVQKDLYRLYPVDLLESKTIHSFAYAIRAGMFSVDEVLVMIKALQEKARKEQEQASTDLFASNTVG